jgi:hypothetical protein
MSALYAVLHYAGCTIHQQCNSKVQDFIVLEGNMATPKKEHPYRDNPDVENIKSTLIDFGYQKLEARYIAREIAQNLKNYLAVQEAMRSRMATVRR